MIPRRLRHIAATAPAAALFLLVVLAPAGRLRPAAQQTVSAPVRGGPQTSAEAAADWSKMVTTTVAVTDKYGRFVAGLKRDSFSVEEGKAAPRIAYFSDQEVPQSIGIVFDTSGSMPPLALAEARGALVRFIMQAHPANEYFILGFDSQLHALTGWTRDGKVIIEALNKLAHVNSKKAGSLFNDACAAAAEKVTQGTNPRRVLLVISDGQDVYSKLGFSAVRETIKRSNALVYVIGTVNYPEAGLAYEARARLEEMAKVTGGAVFFPEGASELDDSLQRVGNELHNHYTIGFVPERRGADGKWRRFKVRVTPPPRMSVRVRSREGYYAAPPAP